LNRRAEGSSPDSRYLNLRMARIACGLPDSRHRCAQGQALSVAKDLLSGCTAFSDKILRYAQDDEAAIEVREPGCIARSGSSVRMMDAKNISVKMF